MKIPFPLEHNDLFVNKPHRIIKFPIMFYDFHSELFFIKKKKNYPKQFRTF